MKVRAILVRHKAKFILTVILLFHLVNNFVILRLDGAPPASHQGGYYTESVRLFFNNTPMEFLKDFIREHPYPPLLYLSPVPFYYIFGIDYDIAAFVTGAIYLSLLLICLYLIGKETFSSETGLLAAFFCSFFTAIFAYSRMFVMALPAVAILTLNIYLMLKSDCFKNRKYSLLFGVTLGLGMLTVFYYIVIFIGIFVGYLLHKRAALMSNPKQTLANICLAFMLNTAVAGPWYIANLNNIISWLRVEKSVLFFNEANIDFTINFQYLVNFQIGIVFIIVFFVAFAFLLFKKKLNTMMILWLVWPYAVTSVLTVPPSPRYNMGTLPLIALIISAGIKEILKNVKYKKIYIVKLVLLSVFCIYIIGRYFYISYDRTEEGPSRVSEDRRFFTTGLLCPYAASFNSGELDLIFNKCDTEKKLVDASGVPYLTNDYLFYMIQIKRLPIFFQKLYFSPSDTVAQYRDYIKKADYLLLRSDNSSDSPNVSRQLESEIVNKIKEFIDVFDNYAFQFRLAKKIFINGKSGNLAFLIYERIEPDI